MTISPIILTALAISMTLISTMMLLSSILISDQLKKKTAGLALLDGVAAVAVIVIGERAILGASEMEQRRRTLQILLVRPQRPILERLAHLGHSGATKRTRKILPPPPASILETSVLLMRRKSPR